MAKKKRPGRPPGAKNKLKTGKRRGRPAGIKLSGSNSTFSQQIENLKAEKIKLLGNVKTIDKAINLLSRFA